MIKTINTGKGIKVNQTYHTDIHVSPGAQGAGHVRWNSNMNCLEINDGIYWKCLNWNYPTIELDTETQEILEWAKNKMAQEREVEKLAKEYPAVAEIKEKMDLILNLVKDHKGG
jgi:hypothetical protein